MIKLIFPFASRLFLLACVFSAQTALAFQMADGAPSVPATPGKYIFYWGSQQCDLTGSNGFRGALHLSPAAFRQMLTNPPILWNGTALNKSFSFRLQDVRINTGHYLEQLGQLHTDFGQTVRSGQVLHLTDLSLNATTTGTIDLFIEDAAENGAKPESPATWNIASNNLNGQYLERVVWGREDIYDLSNRDFFSGREIWQTIQQLPYVEWQMHATPQPLTASIRIWEQGYTVMNFTTVLDEPEYRQMLRRMEHYRHLFYPGTVVELSLHTEKFDQLYLKNMTLVTDNDPRLVLRRNRDLHRLNIRWGAWQEDIGDLYLRRLTDARGRETDADRPVNQRIGFWNKNLELLALLTTQPEIRIDDQPLREFSFRLSMPGFSTRISHAAPLNDSTARLIVERFWKTDVIELDSFQLPGYDLPPIHLSVNYVNLSQRLASKNDFQSLMAATGNFRLRLSALPATETEYRFNLELPEAVFANLSIFEPEGRNVFLSENRFSAGANTVSIPKSAFQRKGKHFCFLNTPLGVVRQELEVE